jgi:hypothetical protein
VTGCTSKLVCALLVLLIGASVRAAEPFAFVALGDTAYNGERDYPIYRRLIAAINAAAPAFSIHVGDVWGVGNCHDAHIQQIEGFFSEYTGPVVYTPGDNEWVDCTHRAMGGYDASERLTALRKAFFAKARSLGQNPMDVARQSDVSPFKAYVENARWERGGVLFVTVNVVGSNNNFRFDDAAALEEAFERNRANVAWLRDGFRIAREGDYAAVVVALHAEMFEERGVARPAFADIVEELKLGAERFRKPVLLINGDTHEFVVDRPLFTPLGEADAPLFANVTRLEVYGAPEIRAVRVGVDTSTPWVFSFSPLYVD